MTEPSPISELAKFTNGQTELELAKVFFDSVLTTSPLIDKTAGWLLAGLGATTALIISNLEKTSLFIGSNSVSFVLWLLLIAGLFGVAQKYLALRVKIQLHVNEKTKAGLLQILSEHEKKKQEIIRLATGQNVSIETNINFMNPIQEIKTVVPWYQRSSFDKALLASMNDPLYSYRNAARLYNRQVVYALMEVVITIFIIIIVASNI